MSREVHVRFWEGLGLKCPGLLTKEPETWDIATYHEFWYLFVYSGRKWPWFPAENGRDFRSKMAMDSGPKWPISERINTKPIAYANHMQLA